MSDRTLPSLLVVLCLTGLVTGLSAAAPPPVGTERNGLTATEVATLWSHDRDTTSGSESLRSTNTTSATAMRQLANGTDITFKRPPATAATWTRNDFDDLDAGGGGTSVHPPDATLKDGQYIQDAHASIFGIHPATQGHLEPGETPFYVAPSGTMRGFVDYRVRVPDDDTTGNVTTDWSLDSHEVETVRLLADSEPITTTDGSHTPALDYDLADDEQVQLTFEATISVALTKTIRIERGNITTIDHVDQTETLTVSESTTVEVYNLSATSYYADYPNGDTGVAIFQSQPWQGYTLTGAGTERVRGVWRFYTARDRSWDTLEESTTSGTTSTSSDAIPVYVHAYPSQIGPRAEPVRDGPQIVDTWGRDRIMPADRLGSNINVDVVDEGYETTYGVAVRAERVDRESLRVGGIVRGEDATLTKADTSAEREIRRSNLTAEVLEYNQTHATVRLTLRDNSTGTPIALTSNERWSRLRESPRTGYLTVGDQRVETNMTGVAVVTVEKRGSITAKYHPDSWLGKNPAYVSDTATVRWHPLGTIDGWFTLLVEIGWRLLPFFLAWYAGSRLLRLLLPDTNTYRQP